MECEIVNCTGWGTADPARAAAELLVFTKQTRLEMTQDQMQRVQQMSWDDIEAELNYMSRTIPSSWEYVDYTFLLNDVTRAFTHQFVRTRTGSYAQQTMRVLNVNGWTYGTGPTTSEGEAGAIYESAMIDVAKAYDDAIAAGASIEDARGVLPTNIHTNIVAKFSLRTLAEMFRKRASTRTQGEYRDVIDAMRKAVVAVHPWSEMFFSRTFDVAAAELEAKVNSMGLGTEERINMIKLIDQMRQS